MSDEVSNHEQLILCLRWIDKNSEQHEDMIGLYQVKNVKFETLFASIKYGLIQMGIPLTDCRGRYYGGSSSMVRATSGSATGMNKIHPRVLL